MDTTLVITLIWQPSILPFFLSAQCMKVNKSWLVTFNCTFLFSVFCRLLWVCYTGCRCIPLVATSPGKCCETSIICKNNDQIYTEKNPCVHGILCSDQGDLTIYHTGSLTMNLIFLLIHTFEWGVIQGMFLKSGTIYKCQPEDCWFNWSSSKWSYKTHQHNDHLFRTGYAHSSVGLKVAAQ